MALFRSLNQVMPLSHTKAEDCPYVLNVIATSYNYPSYCSYNLKPNKNPSAAFALPSFTVKASPTRYTSPE